jgi:hypothetical protein
MSTFSLSSVYAQLTSFANLENFWSLFNTAFGSSYDFAAAASLKSQWQSQDFSLFPQIEKEHLTFAMSVNTYSNKRK